MALLTITISGCGTQSRLVSQVATPQGPITVEAIVDGPAEIETSVDGNVPKVILHLGNKQEVVIEAARAFVDGKLYGVVPADTQKIDIVVKNGNVTLSADGRSLSDLRSPEALSNMDY